MDQLTPSPMILSSSHRQQIIEIAERENPFEACGLITCKGKESQAVIQIPNVLASRSAYRMAGPELVNALWTVESEGWSVLAFFHSHPNSPPIPSPTDLAEHHYPEIPQIILGVIGQTWQFAAYLIRSESYAEIPIIIS